jgi:hypothetical protein
MIMKNDYEIRGENTVIFLKHKDYGRLESFISTTDLDAVKNFPNTWFPLWNGHTKSFYVEGRIYHKGKTATTIRLHRLIMGVTDSRLHIDHINHNTLDNTRGNLNVVTCGENAQNRRKASNNKSGHTGVRWHKGTKKWQVSIQIEGKYVHLGVYEELDEAIEARKKAEIEHFKYKQKLKE